MDVPPRRSRWKARLLLSGGVLLASLLLAEVGARVVLDDAFVPGELCSRGWKVAGRFDEELGWALRAGVTARVADVKVDYRLRTSSAALRDPERAREKPAGARRAVLLGDSVSWGWGVDDGARFSDLLDRRLGPDVEVLNLAVPGYGTDQQLLALRRHGFDWDPDVVVVVVVSNDLVEVRYASRYGMAKPHFQREGGEWRPTNLPLAPPERPLVDRLRELTRGLESHSALAQALFLPPARQPLDEHRRELQAGAQRVERSHLNEERADRLETMALQLEQPGSRAHTLLERLHAECAGRGVRLLATSVPHKHDFYLLDPAVPLPDDLDPQAEELTPLSRGLAAAASTIGFEAVSIDRALLAATRAGDLLTIADGHLNERGNEVVAAALEPALRRALRDG